MPCRLTEQHIRHQHWPNIPARSDQNCLLKRLTTPSPERDIADLVVNELRAILPGDVMRKLEPRIRRIVDEKENCADDLADIVVTEILKIVPIYTQRRLVLERRVRRALAWTAWRVMASIRLRLPCGGSR